MNTRPPHRLTWISLTLMATACGSRQENRDVRAESPTLTAGVGSAGEPAATSQPRKASPSVIAAGAPRPDLYPEGGKPTPRPTTSQERARQRLARDLTERAAPHLIEPESQLHGVQVLASAPPGAAPIDALLVKVLARGGQIDSYVLLLDEEGTLRARLPRAVAAGPHAIRIGALNIPLDMPEAWEGIASGTTDPAIAGAVLRLGAMLARDRLPIAAQKGWESLEKEGDTRLLGVCQERDCRPGEVPDGIFEAPERFRVVESLPLTLEGWSTEGETWRGIAKFAVVTPPGLASVLRVGLRGRLP